MDNQDAVEVTCTDNGKKVTGYILNYRAKDQLEISLNTVFGLIGAPLVSITSEVGQVPVNGTQTFSAALITQATGAVLTPALAANSLNVLVTSPSPRSPVKGTTVIGAWMTKTLNITPSTTSFAVKMSNTQGMAIQFGNNNNNPKGWDGRINGAVNGTFDFDLTIQ